MIPIAKPCLTKDEAQAAFDTVLSGWITQGPKVAEFEEKFANYIGTKYAVAVSNCTAALHLSLIVAGITHGDEVICPSMSYIATANAIKHAGGTPVFAEIKQGGYNIDPVHVEKLITPKTKAVLIVHQIGMPADIDAFKRLSEKYSIALIEDAACAIGSAYKGVKIGNHSELVCFSFHPRKVISTGDGGMITTNDEAYYNRLRLLRQHGMSINDYVRHKSDKILYENYVEVGYNYRLTDIQAAIGIKQLEKVNWLIAERRKVTLAYHEAFKNIACIQLPIEDEGYFSNYQSYSIYLKNNCPISRDEVIQKMSDAGIATRRGVMNIHREFAYEEKYKNISLPISEDVADKSILLPLYVPMEEADIQKVIFTFKSIVQP